MKLGNLRINWHKHKWEKKVVHVSDHKTDNGYLLKVAEVCVADGCDRGSYRSVYFIKLAEKPTVISID